MSARFTAVFEGETFEIEITSDGELSFPGHDEQLEYEIAYAAMGGKPTAAMRLLEAWHGEPVGFICNNLFRLDKNTNMSLAADWAEHVLPLFERGHREDNRPRQAIEAARDFVAEKISPDELDRAQDAAREAASWAGSSYEAWAAAKAAAAAAEMARAEAAESAALYAAAAVRAETNNKATERAWQVRHFVHCMERLQTNKKWPKIEETP
jgi:hypothetical protein